MVSVIAEMAGSSDEIILKWAHKNNRIIITNDKDFGELIYRQGLLHSGVILLRLEEDAPEKRFEVIKKVLLRFEGKLKEKFIVATEKKIRLRS